MTKINLNKKGLDAIVIGGGPAGISCAGGLKHAGASVVLFESRSLGGLLKNAYKLSNLPGFYGFSGEQVCNLLAKHAKSLQLDVVYNKIGHIKKVEQDWNVFAEDKPHTPLATCRYLVLATGSIPKKLEAFHDRDRCFYQLQECKESWTQRGGTIIVIGAGEIGLDSALSLASLGAHVKVVAQQISPWASLTLVNQVKDSNLIELCLGAKAEQRDDVDGKIFVKAGHQFIEGNHLLICAGRRAHVNLLESQNLENLTRDALENLGAYICGDVANQNLRQSAIAMGEGLSVAMKIQMRLGLNQ